MRPDRLRSMALTLAPASRLWLDVGETVFYAMLTINLRMAKLASAFWTRGDWPVAESLRMVSEKQVAAMQAMAAAWTALPRGNRRVDPVKVAAAAVRPYRRHTRRNAKRLSRSR